MLYSNQSYSVYLLLFLFIRIFKVLLCSCPQCSWASPACQPTSFVRTACVFSGSLFSLPHSTESPFCPHSVSRFCWLDVASADSACKLLKRSCFYGNSAIRESYNNLILNSSEKYIFGWILVSRENPSVRTMLSICLLVEIKQFYYLFSHLIKFRMLINTFF